MEALEIAFAAVTVVFVVAMAYLLRTCARTGVPGLAAAAVPVRPGEKERAGATVEAGLDEDAMKTLPKVVVQRGEVAASAVTCCAVCLGEYSRGDVLRVLPGCAHAFHGHCVDQWLRLHPSCPVCRTPPSTPAPSQP